MTGLLLPPSIRGEGSRKPEALARTLLANLPQLVDALENGSIVTFEPARIRVRLLPIGPRAGDEQPKPDGSSTRCSGLETQRRFITDIHKERKHQAECRASYRPH